MGYLSGDMAYDLVFFFKKKTENGEEKGMVEERAEFVFL